MDLWPGFDPRPSHMGFVVDEEAQEQNFFLQITSVFYCKYCPMLLFIYRERSLVSSLASLLVC